MKLIIDIPEETYNDIQSRDWKNGELVFSEEWKAIHNSIPLDEVLQKIRQEIISSEVDENHTEERWFNMGLFKVLEIIDNLDKKLNKGSDKE